MAQWRYIERTAPEYFGSGAAIPVVSEASETESAISWLRLHHRRKGDCVVFVYRDHIGYSCSMIGKLLGVCQRTVWRDLDPAYVLLLDYFSARAAGEPLPQMKELDRS